MKTNTQTNDTPDKTGLSAANTAQTVANELAGAFEYDTRTNGDKFAKIKSDAPAWTRQCLMLRVHAAIDDRLPDDWIYDKAASIASQLAEHESIASMRDSVYEIADGEVDIYNAERYAWLASHLLNASIVDEAVEELGASDQGICGNIGIGQYVACERIANALIEEIENELETRENLAD